MRRFHKFSQVLTRSRVTKQAKQGQTKTTNELQKALGSHFKAVITALEKEGADLGN